MNKIKKNGFTLENKDNYINDINDHDSTDIIKENDLSNLKNRDLIDQNNSKN